MLMHYSYKAPKSFAIYKQEPGARTGLPGNLRGCSLFVKLALLSSGPFEGPARSKGGHPSHARLCVFKRSGVPMASGQVESTGSDG